VRLTYIIGWTLLFSLPTVEGVDKKTILCNPIQHQILLPQKLTHHLFLTPTEEIHYQLDTSPFRSNLVSYCFKMYALNLKSSHKKRAEQFTCHTVNDEESSSSSKVVWVSFARCESSLNKVDRPADWTEVSVLLLTHSLPTDRHTNMDGKQTFISSSDFLSTMPLIASDEMLWWGPVFHPGYALSHSELSLLCSADSM